MREFRSIAAFVTHIAEVDVVQREGQAIGLERAAVIIETEAKAEIGHYQEAVGPFAAWAELADSTKADRVQRGFSENEPLLRTGALRDSIQHRSDNSDAMIGSDSPIAEYQELGTATIPPRSFLGGAAARKSEEAVNEIGRHIVAGLIGVNVFQGRLPI